MFLDGRCQGDHVTRLARFLDDFREEEGFVGAAHDRYVGHTVFLQGLCENLGFLEVQPIRQPFVGQEPISYREVPNQVLDFFEYLQRKPDSVFY